MHLLTPYKLRDGLIIVFFFPGLIKTNKQQKYGVKLMKHYMLYPELKNDTAIIELDLR